MDGSSINVNVPAPTCTGPVPSHVTVEALRAHPDPTRAISYDLLVFKIFKRRYKSEKDDRGCVGNADGRAERQTVNNGVLSTMTQTRDPEYGGQSHRSKHVEDGSTWGHTHVHIHVPTHVLLGIALILASYWLYAVHSPWSLSERLNIENRRSLFDNTFSSGFTVMMMDDWAGPSIITSAAIRHTTHGRAATGPSIRRPNYCRINTRASMRKLGVQIGTNKILVIAEQICGLFFL
eukprot:1190649-Prorocentrum_minimum.AAC.1